MHLLIRRRTRTTNGGNKKNIDGWNFDNLVYQTKPQYCTTVTLGVRKWKLQAGTRSVEVTKLQSTVTNSSTVPEDDEKMEEKGESSCQVTKPIEETEQLTLDVQDAIDGDVASPLHIEMSRIA